MVLNAVVDVFYALFLCYTIVQFVSLATTYCATYNEVHAWYYCSIFQARVMVAKAPINVHILIGIVNQVTSLLVLLVFYVLSSQVSAHSCYC